GPPAPPPETATAGGLAQIRRERTGARDDVEQDVPLGAEDHQRAEPDIGIEAVADDHHDEYGKREVGGKRRQKLRQRLDSFGELWSQPDPDPDRHPDQRRQRDQHDDAKKREQSVAERY